MSKHAEGMLRSVRNGGRLDVREKAPEPPGEPLCARAQQHRAHARRLAYFIELDGDVHVPMYEKFETEPPTGHAGFRDHVRGMTCVLVESVERAWR
jgi:hypothetical protein